jgi:DNA-binding transcriptional regulator YiaG
MNECLICFTRFYVKRDQPTYCGDPCAQKAAAIQAANRAAARHQLAELGPLPTPEQLRALRVAKGYTQIEVSKALGRPRAAFLVERWENGRHTPRPENYWRWVDTLRALPARRNVGEPDAQ